MEIIKIRDLTKKYGGNIAVDNISLNITEGEIFGLLGQMVQERVQRSIAYAGY
jgi:ABC-type multidrug transport system ATPase subunit